MANIDKLQFKTNRLSADPSSPKMLEFDGPIKHWMVGVTGFQLKVLKDLMEGKHIQIRNMQVEVDCVKVGDQTLQLSPTLIFDNQAEGGALNTVESYVSVTSVVAAEAFSGDVSMVAVEDVTSSTSVSVPAGHDELAVCLSGFHMHFKKEARELKNASARVSVASSGDTAATVSGNADMNGKDEFTLDIANFDASVFTANRASLGNRYEIVRMSGLHADTPVGVPGSDNFKSIYPILSKFYVEFANNEHREVWYIKADVDVVDDTSGFQVIPRIEMIGGDNQVGQTGSGSNIDLVIIAEKLDSK